MIIYAQKIRPLPLRIGARPLCAVRLLYPIPYDTSLYTPVYAHEIFPYLYRTGQDEDGFQPIPEEQYPGFEQEEPSVEEPPVEEQTEAPAFEYATPGVIPEYPPRYEPPQPTQYPGYAPGVHPGVPLEYLPLSRTTPAEPSLPPELPPQWTPMPALLPEEVATVPGTLANAARSQNIVKLTYTKLNGATNNYEVEPYSYRSRIPQRTGYPGIYLFAYDASDNRIKSFLVDRITSAEMLPLQYDAKWLIEL